MYFSFVTIFKVFKRNVACNMSAPDTPGQGAEGGTSSDQESKNVPCKRKGLASWSIEQHHAHWRRWEEIRSERQECEALLEKQEMAYWKRLPSVVTWVVKCTT